MTDIWKHIWAEYVSIYWSILMYIDRYMKKLENFDRYMQQFLKVQTVLYTFLYRPIYELLYWSIYECFLNSRRVWKPKIANLRKIKIFIYRSKNDKFWHISVEKWFLKNFIYRSIFDIIYRSIYHNFNIDRYMLTYSEEKKNTFQK